MQGGPRRAARARSRRSSARHYLFGAEPCYADFSLYHALWPLWLPEDLRPMLKPYPRMLAFMERMTAIGHGKSAEITSGDAIQIAKSSTLEPVKNPVALETNGIDAGSTGICDADRYRP